MIRNAFGLTPALALSLAVGCSSETIKSEPEVGAHSALEFEGIVDPSKGTIEVTRVYATSAGGLQPATVVQDGIPNSGPTNTVELVTGMPFNGSGQCGFPGTPTFCADVTINSFYSGPLTEVFAQLTNCVPVHGALNTDSDPRLSNTYGIWSYNTINGGAGGTRRWVFADDGTAFRISGRVMATLCTNGIQDGDETDVDCGGTDCSACGPAPSCTDGIQNQGETGIDCGGPCAACPTCSDGIQNQGETGIDCGGPCPACATCTDGIQNQGEAGIDCGGPCPTACVSCTDGIQNGGETGIDCGGPCPFGCNLVVNEVEYDEVATDNAEFIEIYNPTASTVSLTGMAVILVNGASSPSFEYDRVNLSGTLTSGQFGVICVGAAGACSTVTVPGGARIFNFGGAATADRIQNGAPDAVGLFNVATRTAIDTLSYEGAVTNASLTLLGMTSSYNFVEGTPATAQENNAAPNLSMQRSPNGRDTNDANTDWVTATPTPGAANL